MAYATISQHLRELKDAGLISGKIGGNSVCYCISGETWLHYRDQFKGFFVKGSSRISAADFLIH